jgi:hypothetical protein
MRASDQRSHNRAKLTRKDLKAPDEFITATGRILILAGQHLRTISFILGGILACVVVVWGLVAYFRATERDAFATLWQIEGQLRGVTDAHAVPAAPVEHLQQIAHQFGAGEARGYAWLYLGHVDYRKGEYGAAATAYLRAAAEAQAAYQRVIDAKPMGFLMEAYLGKARAAEQDHDVDTALTTYAAVIDQFPSGAETLNLIDKVETLKGRR